MKGWGWTAAGPSGWRGKERLIFQRTISLAWADLGGRLWAGTDPSQAAEVSQAGKRHRAGVGGDAFSPLLPGGSFLPGAKPSPAQSFLPQSRRRLGPWVGGLGSRPDLTARPCLLPLAPRPRCTAAAVGGTAVRPPGSCNLIPRAGRARARAAAVGPGLRVRFQREPLGTSVERTDAAASHGPGPPVARPPPGLQLPPPPTLRGRGEGEATSGSQGPLWTLGTWPQPPQKAPALHRVRPPVPGLG